MNCKPGDLAVCVYADSGLEWLIGKLVTVSVVDERFSDLVTWKTEPTVPDRRGGFVAFCDCDLRPIRDNDGEDETLTWAGKPEKVTA